MWRHGHTLEANLKSSIPGLSWTSDLQLERMTSYYTRTGDVMRSKLASTCESEPFYFSISNSCKPISVSTTGWAPLKFWNSWHSKTDDIKIHRHIISYIVIICLCKNRCKTYQHTGSGDLQWYIIDKYNIINWNIRQHKITLDWLLNYGGFFLLPFSGG